MPHIQDLSTDSLKFSYLFNDLILLMIYKLSNYSNVYVSFFNNIIISKYEINNYIVKLSMHLFDDKYNNLINYLKDSCN